VPLMPAHALACSTWCTRLVPAACCLFAKRTTVRWVRLAGIAPDWELTNADSSGLEETTAPCARSGSIAGSWRAGEPPAARSSCARVGSRCAGIRADVQASELMRDAGPFYRGQVERCSELGIDAGALPVSHLAVRTGHGASTWFSVTSSKNGPSPTSKTSGTDGRSPSSSSQTRCRSPRRLRSSSSS